MTPSAAKPTANTVRPTRWAPAGAGTLASCAARYALADRQTPVPMTRHCRQSLGGAASSSAGCPAPRDAAAAPGSATCPCSAGAAAGAELPGRSTPGAAGPAECAGAGITLRSRGASAGLRPPTCSPSPWQSPPSAQPSPSAPSAQQPPPSSWPGKPCRPRPGPSWARKPSSRAWPYRRPATAKQREPTEVAGGRKRQQTPKDGRPCLARHAVRPKLPLTRVPQPPAPTDCRPQLTVEPISPTDTLPPLHSTS